MILKVKKLGTKKEKRWGGWLEDVLMRLQNESGYWVRKRGCFRGKLVNHFSIPNATGV